jgi:uncharacterized RDD family membrane protein YckC
MTDQPKDVLAEHPIGSEEAGKKPASSAGNLELFPLPEEGAPDKRASRSAKRSPHRRETPAVNTPPETPEEAPEPLEEAGEAETASRMVFTRRVVAGLADILILVLLGTVQLAAGAVLLELRFPPASLLGVSGFLALASLVLLVLVPFVWGTTPGLALVDLRILAPDGGSPSLDAAFLRFVGFVLTVGLGGIPMLLAAFDKNGRTLADLVSRTSVVPIHHEQGAAQGPEAG